MLRAHVAQTDSMFVQDRVGLVIRETDGHRTLAVSVVEHPEDGGIPRLVMRQVQPDETSKDVEPYGLSIRATEANALREALNRWAEVPDMEAQFKEAMAEAEARLENTVSDLDVALSDLRAMTAERDGWESLVTEKDEHMGSVRDHLADARETVALERERAMRLQDTVDALTDDLKRALATLEALRQPARWITPLGTQEPTPVAVSDWASPDRMWLVPNERKCQDTTLRAGMPGPVRCLLPDNGHRAHSDGVYAWNEGTIQRLGGLGD